MKNKPSVAIWVLLLGFTAWSLVGVSFIISRVEAQRIQEQPKARTAVEQHFKVVPNVKPSDLETEIKKLNAQGYIVGQSELLTVGDSITIFITDEGEDEEDR